MAMEHANSFVYKIFEDDKFLISIIERRAFKKHELSNEELENEKIVTIANDMGFKFDLNEFREACKLYMDNLDGWESAQKIFHLLKVISKKYKE